MPNRQQTATVFSTPKPKGRTNPFIPAIRAADDDIELTPAQAAACWDAVKAVAVAGTTMIDSDLLDEIETKALAGEQMAGNSPWARRRALAAYFGLPA